MGVLYLLVFDGEVVETVVLQAQRGRCRGIRCLLR